MRFCVCPAYFHCHLLSLPLLLWWLWSLTFFHTFTILSIIQLLCSVHTHTHNKNTWNLIELHVSSFNKPHAYIHIYAKRKVCEGIVRYKDNFIMFGSFNNSHLIKYFHIISIVVICKVQHTLRCVRP